MPVPAEIARLVGEIESDRVRGAAELARQAVLVLKAAAEHSRAADVESFLHEQSGVAQALVFVRPAMAPIRNITTRLTRAVSARAAELDVASLRAFTISKADETVAGSLLAVGRVAQNLVPLIAEGTTVMTHSYSSTVVAALREAFARRRGMTVVVTRSGPGRTGEQIARALAGAAVSVTLVDDAAAAVHMPSVDVVVLGADTVCPDGVVNGIGSYQLAVVSAAAGVPLYALCDSLKFDAGMTRGQVDLEHGEPSEVAEPAALPDGVVVDNPRFDITPLELIAGIVTEEGVLRGSDVASHLRRLCEDQGASTEQTQV